MTGIFEARALEKEPMTPSDFTMTTQSAIECTHLGLNTLGTLQKVKSKPTSGAFLSEQKAGENNENIY